MKEVSEHWGQPFVTDAQDFFIVGRDSYPWSEVPDFVVGRVGYDNWLVSIPLTNNNAHDSHIVRTGRSFVADRAFTADVACSVNI